MKVKKRDLLRLHNAIHALEGKVFNVKFSYFIAKNKVAMRDEITALEEARKVSDEYKKYDTERATLAQQYSDKNEDGSAKIQGNSFVITTNAELFQEDLEGLRVKYKDAIEEYETMMKDFEELLNQEVEYDGTKVDLKDVPQTIEPAILETFILADLIIDEEF